MLSALNGNLKKIKDAQLLTHFSEAVGKEKEAVALVILHLSEISRRKLFAKEGYSSLYVYLREKYHYSEGGAYRRIQAARLSQRHPKIISYLKSGKLNLMIISLIAPYMTSENEDELMRETMGKSKQKIELLLAERYGKKREMVRDEIRRLPQRLPMTRLISKPISNLSVNNAGTAAVGGNVLDASPKKPSDMSCNVTGDITGFFGGSEKKKLTAQIETEERRVKIVFGAKEQVAQKLKRAQEILKHKYPGGKLENIMDEVLEVFLEAKDPERKYKRVEKRRKKATHPLKTETVQKTIQGIGQEIGRKVRKQKRYIPADIRRKVWLRDKGKCQYKSPHKGPNTKACGERSGLEFEHVRPFALSGRHTPENLMLLCMQHNRLRSFQTFGQVVSSVSK